MENKGIFLLQIALLVILLLSLSGILSISVGTNEAEDLIANIVALNLIGISAVIFLFYTVGRIFKERRYSASKLMWIGIFILGMGTSSLINGYGEGFLLGVIVGFLILTFSPEFVGDQADSKER
ncbi:MAG: hypothetical protein KAQ87_04760 [Candidatus Pacebacteria bacterium]|nr:hypothetical protein [Candidatus Paceibacterota bacterium]